MLARAHDFGPDATVLTDAKAVRGQIGMARQEVCVLRRGGQTPPAALTARVRIRTVCDRSFFVAGGGWKEVDRARRSGEQVRLTTAVPLDLIVVDGRCALLPVGDGAVLVGRSPLLDSLVAIFESTWAAAVEPSEEDRAIVALIATGLKDEAIARQLGIAPRTLRRRIARIMDALGADTRFQAGMQAVRRGWL